VPDVGAWKFFPPRKKVSLACDPRKGAPPRLFRALPDKSEWGLPKPDEIATGHNAFGGVAKSLLGRAFSYMLAKKGELSIARELDVSDLHVEVIDLMNNRVEGEIGLGSPSVLRPSGCWRLEQFRKSDVENARDHFDARRD
jgi:hypothetical protein